MAWPSISPSRGRDGHRVDGLTGWQHQSLRGFLSGTAKKKLGLTVERIAEDGRTVYRVPSVSAGD
jgi:hypothetical protein